MPKYLKLRVFSGYSWVNIIGLTLALSFGFFIFTYVSYETSYDRAYPDAQQIYRLGATYDIGENIDSFSNIARPVGPNMAKDYAGIAAQTRIAGYNGLYTHKAFFDYNRNQVSSQHVFYADSSFFEVFERRFIPGSNPNPLSAPNSIVLTQSLATKIFGDESPINKVIELEGSIKVTVTAVMEDLGFKTHLPYEALLSWDLGARPGEYEVWIGWHVYTYLKFNPNYSADELKSAFPAFSEKYMKETIESFNAKVEIILQPLSSIHLYSDLIWEAYPNNNISNIYILSAIGIFLLLIAIVNYINLATARAVQRAREVGIRKVMGSSRAALIWQFLRESLTVTLLSSILGLVIIVLVWPPYNDLANLELSLFEVLTVGPILAYFCGAMLIGIAAGIYPAFYLSNITASVVLQGKYMTSKRGKHLRKTLVAFQFATSTALIIGTIVVLRQLGFIASSDLGFNDQNVMVVKVQNNPTEASLTNFLTRLTNNEEIISASVSASVPGEELNQTFFEVPDQEGVYNSHSGRFMEIDGGFIEMIGMKVLKGRDFNYDSEKDRNSAVLLNQAAAKSFGWGLEALGNKIGFGTDSLGNRILHEIIGIVQDFHIGSMYTKIEPVAIFLSLEEEKNVFLRLKNNNIQQAVELVSQEWSQFDSKFPMDYTFLDENYKEFYANDQRLFTLLIYISLIILFVSLLGLVGLVTFSVNVRKREICMRRVLGSAVKDIYKLLSKEYFVLLSLAFVTGGVASWYFLDSWLSGFHYRVDVEGWEFLCTFILVSIAVLSVLVSISTKTIKANPSDVLRSE